jgi:hypothetical protein
MWRAGLTLRAHRYVRIVTWRSRFWMLGRMRSKRRSDQCSWANARVFASGLRLDVSSMHKGNHQRLVFCADRTAQRILWHNRWLTTAAGNVAIRAHAINASIGFLANLYSLFKQHLRAWSTSRTRRSNRFLDGVVDFSSDRSQNGRSKEDDSFELHVVPLT